MTQDAQACSAILIEAAYYFKKQLDPPRRVHSEDRIANFPRRRYVNKDAVLARRTAYVISSDNFISVGKWYVKERAIAGGQG